MEQDSNLAPGYETRECLWVQKVIRTCKHPAQLHMCNALIDLLKKKQNDIETDTKLQEVFHEKAIKLNYYQFAETILKERLS